MKLVFRITYHTVPGESLWLVMQIHDGKGKFTLRDRKTMHWRDMEHWETQVEIDAKEDLTIDYHYQVRREHNGAVINEWNTPRRLHITPAACDALIRLDDWCSAGTVDHLYETQAFSVSPPRPAASVLSTENHTHHLSLHMAAVPQGHIPCVLGNIDALGSWDYKKATPLHPSPTTPNLWETYLTLPADAHIEFKFGLGSSRGQSTRRINCLTLEGGGNRLIQHHQYASRQLTRISCQRYQREPRELLRASGVAVPVFSLRSEESLGIGEFADLIPLADWAADVGFKLVQILPINDTTSANDWTDSYPYSAISVFALHPAYLRLTDLHLATLAKTEITKVHRLAKKLNALAEVDYEAVMTAKWAITRDLYESQFSAITRAPSFIDFLEENREWLIPYAAFCVMRDEFRTADFSKWKNHAIYCHDEVASWADAAHPRWPAMAYHIWLQYELDAQLNAAVTHLHARGIALKGDLPIGIDRQSVDAWSTPHLFHLDAQTGAPPDAFAVKGQNWGFPTYDWHAMRQDGYAWWCARFAKLSRYFDAYRIDHILGFFRIWQIPIEHTEGIMGFFDPATPVHVDEIRARGIQFDLLRHCRPYIHEAHLGPRFGSDTHEAKTRYLEPCGHGYWKLRDAFATQRLIEKHFLDLELEDPSARERTGRLRQGLIDCAAEVLFIEHPGSHGSQFHPRCALYRTRSFNDLPRDQQEKIMLLYNDYFYHRQEGLWEAHALELLPVMRAASPMLLCGEDLGMVPSCLPGVLRELGILSLEIQRMPKTSDIEFLDPAKADYPCVVSPSTHDMPTLRMWWREDPHATARFAWQFFHEAHPSAELSGATAERILRQQFESPAMWTIIPIQDLLAIDETLRRENPEDERINIPAIMPYYWRYRLHLDIKELANAKDFNARLGGLLQSRCSS